MLKLEETKEIYEVPSIGFNDSHYLAKFAKRDMIALYKEFVKSKGYTDRDFKEWRDNR